MHPPAFDLLFRNGSVVDGTGNPPFQSDVAVHDGKIRILRRDRSDAQASRVIDIAGLTIAPGFIDMHSHSGLVLLAEPEHRPKLLQGVTTEVIGVDGISYAPIDNTELRDLVDYNAGLDGRPDIAYDWDTVESYLEKFRRAASVNVALMVGNSPLRIAGVGWDAVDATSAQVRSMQSMLREALEEGAFGLSTGLDYPPGAYATTEELIALSETVANAGGFYHTHVRYQLGDRFLDPFREAIDIGHRSGCPIHLTHFYRRENAPGGARELLGLVELEYERGLEITFDAYPYPWNSTRLTILLPWSMQEGGPGPLRQRLEDPAERPGLRQTLDEHAERLGGAPFWDNIRLTNFEHAAHEEYDGLTVAAISDRLGQHPADVVADLLLAENLGINRVGASPDPSTLRDFCCHDLAMVGSDSVFLGRFPSPRTYGTFPRVLGEFALREQLMSLPQVIRRMTSMPAQRLGIQDRGLVRDDCWADLVVFDPETISPKATFAEPRQYSEGVRYVTVNGTLTVDDGHHTGATAGVGLRS